MPWKSRAGGRTAVPGTPDVWLRMWPDETEPSGAEGLADVRIINAIYKSARNGQSVSVGAAHKDERPSKAQEIKRPPVEKPETVGAGSPHQD